MTSADPASAPPRLPRRARILLPILLLALVVVSVHRYRIESERAISELSGRALGTTWTVKIAGGLDLPTQRALVRRLAGRLDRVDALMSSWRDDSELSRFNAAEAGLAFPLSPETLVVFEIAQSLSARSGGAFDVTVGALVDAWGFGAPERTGVAPAPERLAALRASTGYQKLALDRAAGTVTKHAGGLRCDLSALAKGFAVDQLAETLAEQGYASFLVEVGGELRAQGRRPEGRAWRVAVEEPDVAGRRIHRIVALEDRALATSGDYRNYYELEGRRVSHTLDPRTGEPIRHALASVSVVHPSAAWADAWATALNVLGPEAGYRLAEEEGLAAYFLVRKPDGGFEPRMTPSFEPLLLPTSPPE
jgi:thiamine biosynthesis lipoprotein